MSNPQDEREALTDEIKEAFVAQFGDDRETYLGRDGSWYIEGFKAARQKYRAALANQRAEQPEAVPQGGQWKALWDQMMDYAEGSSGPPTRVRAKEWAWQLRRIVAAPPSPQPPAAQALVPEDRERPGVAAMAIYVLKHHHPDPSIEQALLEARLLWDMAHGTGTAKPAPERVALTPLTEEMVTRAARELCKIHAGECQVDEQDTWNVYAEQFTRDARAALEAAHGITAPAGGGEG